MKTFIEHNQLRSKKLVGFPAVGPAFISSSQSA